jgi:hypothetical protein
MARRLTIPFDAAAAENACRTIIGGQSLTEHPLEAQLREAQLTIANTQRELVAMATETQHKLDLANKAYAEAEKAHEEATAAYADAVRVMSKAKAYDDTALKRAASIVKDAKAAAEDILRRAQQAADQRAADFAEELALLLKPHIRGLVTHACSEREQTDLSRPLPVPYAGKMAAHQVSRTWSGGGQPWLDLLEKLCSPVTVNYLPELRAPGTHRHRTVIYDNNFTNHLLLLSFLCEVFHQPPDRDSARSLYDLLPADVGRDGIVRVGYNGDLFPSHATEVTAVPGGRVRIKSCSADGMVRLLALVRGERLSATCSSAPAEVTAVANGSVRAWNPPVAPVFDCRDDIRIPRPLTSLPATCSPATPEVTAVANSNNDSVPAWDLVIDAPAGSVGDSSNSAAVPESQESEEFISHH